MCSIPGLVLPLPESPERGARQLFSSLTPPPPECASALAGVMPPLAGEPLEPPRFHETGWRSGQQFRESDDPDRTAEPWAPPGFVLETDPRAQAARTTVEELDLQQAPSKDFSRGDRKGSFACVVRHVLGEEQCAALIEQVNAKGFTPALLNVGYGRQQLTPEVRDGHRVIVDSPQLADWLLEVLRPHLPAELPDGSRIAGLNERCRFLCYTPGQSFEEHWDGCYRRPSSHPQAGDRSWVTVQLYLHDVPASHGGATTFFPGRKGEVGHQPEVGSVLLFTQDLLHEGSLLKEGLKYTLRTEVMYTKRREVTTL